MPLAPTPLEQQIIDHIEKNGDLRLDQFMATALFDPAQGYYTQRVPIGRPTEEGGDFITSPEISQIFGELIAAWCIDLWQRGSHDTLHLIEIGPGRGTLAADLWRVICHHQLDDRVQLHLVETSPRLRQEQAESVPHAHWHNHIQTVPATAPAIIIANEFFDALPIRQFWRTATGWSERYVTRCDDGFRFIDHTFDIPQNPSAPGDARSDRGSCEALFEVLRRQQGNTAPGHCIEICPEAQNYMDHITARLRATGGGLLAFDYGYGTSIDASIPSDRSSASLRLNPQNAGGNSLQALRHHRFVSPLDDIGQADLTAHVDFDALVTALQRGQVVPLPLLTQASFLEAMGIHRRAKQLAQKHPSQATALRLAVQRLIGQDQMGHLFKVLCAISADFPVPAPFHEVATPASPIIKSPRP